MPQVRLQAFPGELCAAAAARDHEKAHLPALRDGLDHLGAAALKRGLKMATYRQKIRAFRRQQTADRRAKLAEFEAERARMMAVYLTTGPVAIAFDNEGFKVLLPDLEAVEGWIRYLKAQIEAVMYAPVHGSYLDEQAPREWHPAGSWIDGSDLMDWD